MKYTGTGTDFYVATPECAELVNLAIAIRRPLLVEGEPGTGKTVLARSIANELGAGELICVHVRSTSQARDLLYRFDAMRRLQDAQCLNNEDAKFTYPYLSLGPLGRAIADSERRVVLIDEIDKADMDFPNDLLAVLDTFEFIVEDLPEGEEEQCRQKNGFGRRVASAEDSKPIVIVTSNREKYLPEPFLRRCLYLRLEFPDDAIRLRQIVEKNTRVCAADLDKKLVSAAVESFRKVRAHSLNDRVRKPPSTSELIDWVQILHIEKCDADSVASAGDRPPRWETLFKSAEDVDGYRTSSGRD